MPRGPAPSDDAVRKATGHGWQHWFALLDDVGLEPGHTERAKMLAAAEPDLPGWWCQTITVEFERARGLREHGQASTGDFQVNVSKTVPRDPIEAYHQVVAALWPDADWTVGTAWDAEGGSVEVRRADPGQMLRWFWHEAGGKSTVEVYFEAKGDKTQIVLRHHQLSSAAARETWRKHWKGVLERTAD